MNQELKSFIEDGKLFLPSDISHCPFYIYLYAEMKCDLTNIAKFLNENNFKVYQDIEDLMFNHLRPIINVSGKFFVNHEIHELWFGDENSEIKVQSMDILYVKEKL